MGLRLGLQMRMKKSLSDWSVRRAHTSHNQRAANQEAANLKLSLSNEFKSGALNEIELPGNQSCSHHNCLLTVMKLVKNAEKSSVSWTTLFSSSRRITVLTSF